MTQNALVPTMQPRPFLLEIAGVRAPSQNGFLHWQFGEDKGVVVNGTAGNDMLA